MSEIAENMQEGLLALAVGVRLQEAKQNDLTTARCFLSPAEPSNQKVSGLTGWFISPPSAASLRPCEKRDETRQLPFGLRERTQIRLSGSLRGGG
jgi:hypothetical protein